eukprot:2834164-Prymnesium_polylepis.3
MVCTRRCRRPDSALVGGRLGSANAREAPRVGLGRAVADIERHVGQAPAVWQQLETYQRHTPICVRRAVDAAVRGCWAGPAAFGANAAWVDFPHRCLPWRADGLNSNRAKAERHIVERDSDAVAAEPGDRNLYRITGIARILDRERGRCTATQITVIGARGKLRSKAGRISGGESFDVARGEIQHGSLAERVIERRRRPTRRHAIVFERTATSKRGCTHEDANSDVNLLRHCERGFIETWKQHDHLDNGVVLPMHQPCGAHMDKNFGRSRLRIPERCTYHTRRVEHGQPSCRSRVGDDPRIRSVHVWMRRVHQIPQGAAHVEREARCLLKWA